MPRELPLGNGTLQINFDSAYRIVDLYYPYVGQDNHGMGHPFRVGVWVDGQFAWTDSDEWGRELMYQPDTLVTQVRLSHTRLNIALAFHDAIDFNRNLFIRHLNITNHARADREVRLFLHHDFHLAGTEVGDTEVGGIARYEHDAYQHVSQDTTRVPGNPWIICTLWLAEWEIARAASETDLVRALELLQWVVAHASPSGCLPEQLHPYTGAPLSVCPLTWSHAAFVLVVLMYLDKLREFTVCPTCGNAALPRYTSGHLLHMR